MAGASHLHPGAGRHTEDWDWRLSGRAANSHTHGMGQLRCLLQGNTAGTLGVLYSGNCLAAYRDNHWQLGTATFLVCVLLHRCRLLIAGADPQDGATAGLRAGGTQRRSGADMRTAAHGAQRIQSRNLPQAPLAA